ncbi:MAG TPA: transglycosylase domain-containing protein [Terriglobales bacterium]|nr:transglycosylase domain-containing protein [Terriglobales bacterium]
MRPVPITSKKPPMLDRLRGVFARFDSWSGPGFARPGLPRWLWITLFAGALAGVTWHETRTSALQSQLFTSLASRLSWTVQPGRSDRIRFPVDGPYDARLGYTRIPDFSRHLESHGFRTLEQARFSPAMEALARLGITPIYDEPDDAGLVVTDAEGDTLYDLTPRGYNFERYEDVPPLVVSSLLYMENRQLGAPPDARTNPTVDWGRLAKATMLYAGHKVGLPLRAEGGSTLATQIEKFRHSNGGRTDSPIEKLRQIVAASLRVYRGGEDTRVARHQIVVDYLNSMPLAAAPGYGDVYGLGEGLYAWFGMDLAEAAQAIDVPGVTPAKARALKHVLALLYAVRAPSAYLVRDRAALEARVDNYVTVLERGDVLPFALARAVRAAPLEFRRGRVPMPDRLDPERKPLYSLRAQLSRSLGVRSFYDLDRLDLQVESTLDQALQDSALTLFDRLRDAQFVSSHGLVGEHLLASGDPSKVIYGLLLYEHTPRGDEERVHVDNLAEPFDLNRGMKMELGSTAKLRTLTHYLQLVAGLYDSLATLPHDELVRRVAQARDPITSWAASTLAENELSLRDFLERSLDRTYSANPGETFFTGGGVHVFHNFDEDDNHRVLPVREAVARSVNLVFVRLMRDIVRYHEARLPYDVNELVEDARSPVRHRLLGEIADQESRFFLHRAWQDQQGFSPAELEAQILGPAAPNPRRLATLFYAWNPGAPASALDSYLRAHGVTVDAAEREHLAKTYGALTLPDEAWLLKRHPLVLWCAGQLAKDPELRWDRLLARSDEARRVSSQWLFKTTNRRAQDLRLRIRIEEDAFARMTPYWRRLGFPFQRLVPSLATAIGSSSDRPQALAHLMGILVNDGVDRAPLSLSRLSFGTETPYSTVFAANRPSGVRVLSAIVARVVRETLLGVVDHGTAVRLKGAFVSTDGDTLPVGGKTGSGDNRYVEFGRGGRLLASLPVNRTAAFVFYIGERYYGVLSAVVTGPQSGQYVFTSSLPVAVLRLYAPSILSRVSQPAPEKVQLMAAHQLPSMPSVPSPMASLIRDSAGAVAGALGPDSAPTSSTFVSASILAAADTLRALEATDSAPARTALAPAPARPSSDSATETRPAQRLANDGTPRPPDSATERIASDTPSHRATDSGSVQRAAPRVANNALHRAPTQRKPPKPAEAKPPTDSSASGYHRGL